MIKIDPVTHLDIVVSIIRNKYLAILALLAALGISMFGIILSLLLPLILYLFPLYLFFTLFINNKVKWAFALLTGMMLSFISLHLNTGMKYIQSLFEYLPLLFLVIYCFILNLKLKEWGYRQEKEKSPLWF